MLFLRDIFEGPNSVQSATHFIDEGHRKVYQGWKFSGVREVDEYIFEGIVAVH